MLTDIWLTDCFDAIYWQYKSDTSFVIGWPPAFNFIADFKNSNEKSLWLKILKEYVNSSYSNCFRILIDCFFLFFSRLVDIQKEKEEGLHLNIKISFNRDNLGSSEPTQYSQSFVSLFIKT